MNGNSFPLVSSILRGAWLIEPGSAEAYMPFVMSLLRGESTAIPNERPQLARPTYYDPQSRTHYKSPGDSAGNKFSVIPVVGPLVKRDELCSYGTSSMMRWLAEADENNNIVAHIIEMDTPGGQVDGTEQFANAVAGTKKPVVVWVNGMMASAGVWIASGADHIMINGDTAEAGSIGTMISLADIRGYYEKQGVKFHHVRATGSPDKNEDFLQLLKGNYKPVVERLLDPVNEVFLGNYKNNRGSKLRTDIENVLTGKMYVGEQIINFGLADSMGTFQDAVDMAQSLVKSSNPNNMSFLNNLFNQHKAEGKQPSEAELQAEVDNRIAELERQNQQLQEQLNQARQTADDAGQQATSQNEEQGGRIAELEQRLNSLEAQNAALVQENQQLGNQRSSARAAQAPESDRFEQQAKVPTLDIEQKAAERGAKIDHSVFERVKGYTLI